MANVRHLFAGSNSGKGFYSLFDNIIDSDAKRVYLLKGGPGTGKSSFMGYLADVIGGKGYTQELFFCSSDSRALDAVSFPELGIAILDATQPHAVEPTWPGCRDQVISLGEFWSTSALEDKRAEIMAGGRIKQGYFASSFRYFAAALAIEENMVARNREEKKNCHTALEEILSLIPSRQVLPDSLGRPRHLFSSALTPEGYVSHIRGLVQDMSTVFILQGGPGSGQNEYLSSIADYTRAAGHDLEVLHYPLNPERILHILIPELKLAVLTELPLENLGELKGHRIDCGPVSLPANDGDYKLWRELLDQGFSTLRQAQSSHGRVEEYYAGAMNFEALTAYRDEVLAQILS